MEEEIRDDMEPIDDELEADDLDDELELEAGKKPKDLLNPEETESLDDLEDEELDGDEEDYGDGDDTYE